MPSTATHTPLPTNTPSATPQPTSTEEPTSIPSKTATPTAVPTKTSTPTPTAAPALVGSVTGNTNLYPEQDGSGQVIGFVPAGNEVTILGRPLSGSWVLLQTEIGTGYASSDFVELPIGMKFEDLPVVNGIEATTIPLTAQPTIVVVADWPTPTSFGAQGTAVSLQSSTINPTPNDSGNSTQFPFVDEGDVVDVLGRNRIGTWLYIRDKNKNEGYVWAKFFDYPGTISQLPVIDQGGPTPTTPATVTRTPGSATLSADVFHLDGSCENGAWIRPIFMEGHGGDGRYTYYWNGDLKAGPISGSTTFDVSAVNGAIIGKARIESGDGQVIEEDYFVPPVNCTS
jgi:hypothetical protein